MTDTERLDKLLKALTDLAGDTCETERKHGERCNPSGTPLELISQESLCWPCLIRQQIEIARPPRGRGGRLRRELKP